MRKLLAAVAGLMLIAGAANAQPPLPPGFQAGLAVTIDAPETFSAGNPITVSGFVYAVFALPVAVEVAQGVPNVDVDLIVDGIVAQTTKTTGGGAYHFDIVLGPNYPTTHTLRTVVLRGTVAESSSSTINTNIDRFITALSVEPSAADVSLGGTLGLRACALYDDGRVRDVTEDASWTSADADVATVSNETGEKGIVTGVGEGTTNVSATIEGKMASADVHVGTGPSSAPVSCPVA
jgi:uncharacterized protein YjdB